MKRLTRKILPPLFSCAFGSLAMLVFLSPAHADPVAAVTPAGLVLSWQAWALVGIAAAGGALKILDVTIAGLRWLAPRTKTTADDTALTDLQVVRADIKAVLDVVGGLVPASGVPTAASDKPAPPTLAVAPAPRDKQAGTTFLGCMIALAIGGGIALILAYVPGCANPKVKALEHALWDCTAPERADAVAAVTPAVVSVIKAAGSADGKQIDLSTVRAAITKANVLSEAGVLLACAAASAVAILEAPAPAPAPGSPAAAPFVLDPLAVRAVWDVVKRDQLGGADFKVAGGAVL